MTCPESGVRPPVPLPEDRFIELDGLMERYQQGDAKAPAALVAALGPSLLRFFRSQEASREHAEDLLQDTWLRIHRGRSSYRSSEPALPWILTIARRVRVDGFRRQRRIVMHERPAEMAPELPAPPEPAAANSPEFERLVAALSDSEREVITLLKLDGLTVEEVAGKQSTTAGAVKQKAHRGYKRLRRLFDGHPPTIGLASGSRAN